MPRGFNNISPYFSQVNSYGQNQNCYYCTVAALNGVTTDALVNHSEIMMQDTAQVQEILTLFRAAGNTDIEFVEVATPLLVQVWMAASIPDQEAVGLAYRRIDNSGHMVVLIKANATLSCLDYQAIHFQMGTPPRFMPFPPEQGISRYYIFYREVNAISHLTKGVQTSTSNHNPNSGVVPMEF